MPLPFESDQLPPKYKTHLPAESTDSLREMGDFMAEPFIGAGKRIKESLSRIYKVAAQPMAGEPVRPPPREEAPVEFYASIAARIVALPLVMMKEILDISTAARTGAGKLRGGPRGELGEWTPEQYQIAAAATMTAGAAVGGGGGAVQPAAIGRGAAYKMLAKDFRALAKKVPTELTVKKKGPGGSFLRTLMGEKLVSGAERETYRELAKALKHIPQEILDPVKEVRLFRSSRRAELGAFGPKAKRVRLKIGQSKEEALGTVGHEFIHAEQLRRHPLMMKRSTPLLERHAYAAEKGFVATVKALPKGERITKEAFDKIYEAGLKALRGRKMQATKVETALRPAQRAAKWRKQYEQGLLTYEEYATRMGWKGRKVRAERRKTGELMKEGETIPFPERLPEGRRYIQKEVPNLPENVPSGFKQGKKMTSPSTGETYSHLRILGNAQQKGYYELQGLTKKGVWETYSVRTSKMPELKVK